MPENSPHAEHKSATTKTELPSDTLASQSPPPTTELNIARANHKALPPTQLSNHLTSWLPATEMPWGDDGTKPNFTFRRAPREFHHIEIKTLLGQAGKALGKLKSASDQGAREHPT